MFQYVCGPKIKQLFLRINIFVKKYSNIQIYLNICQTLSQIKLENHIAYMNIHTKCELIIVEKKFML